jgi:hypothetical protein
VEKQLFSKLYEKVVGKPFSTKTTIVSDANLEKMKHLVAKLPKDFAKGKKEEKEKQKEENDKVLKSDEIGFGGG